MLKACLGRAEDSSMWQPWRGALVVTRHGAHFLATRCPAGRGGAVGYNPQAALPIPREVTQSGITLELRSQPCRFLVRPTPERAWHWKLPMDRFGLESGDRNFPRFLREQHFFLNGGAPPGRQESGQWPSADELVQGLEDAQRSCHAKARKGQ